MNYGKKSTAKKRTALISRSSMMGKRARVSFIRVLFVSLIALCIAVTCLGVGSFRGVIDTAPDVDDIDIMPLGYATFLYDDAGNQIRKLAAPDSNRLPVTLDQIPVDLQHAVVAIEDERFYEHNGIDVKGILRAGMKALTTGDFSEGASTITQQLLKNNVFTNWTSESTQLERFTRKIQEQYLAVQVEKKTDKDTILENYLNTINLGAGSYGVQAAARQYFDKDIWDLNLSECATLAGITQNPTKFNPIINPDSNRKRRKEVLQHMLENFLASLPVAVRIDDRVKFRRVLCDTCQSCTFRKIQIPYILVKILSCGSLYTVGTGTQVNCVQVILKNGVFISFFLNLDSKVLFLDFSRKSFQLSRFTGPVGKYVILKKLLCDRTGTF